MNDILYSEEWKQHRLEQQMQDYDCYSIWVADIDYFYEMGE